MITLNLINNTNTKVARAGFGRICERGKKLLSTRLKKLMPGGGVINLILTGDVEIKKLNKHYRGKDKPTDVLSFAYLENGVIGEIFISVKTARKQAAEKKHSLNRELEILFVHGFLHLLGFDHNNDREEKEMEKWADKILRAGV